MVWSGKEALQLPKISGQQGRVCRRPDKTEIDIPAILIQYTPTDDLHPPHTNSSYQLFPTQAPSPAPPPPPPPPQYHERNPQPGDKSKDTKGAQDSTLPEKNLRNLYVNHSALIRDESGREQRDPADGTKAAPAAKAPLPYPCAPTRAAQRQEFVPWVVEQKPPGPAGDNSLTALQMAKSLSEVDFFPAELRGPPTSASQRPGYSNGPSAQGDRGYSWEKEVKRNQKNAPRGRVRSLRRSRRDAPIEKNSFSLDTKRQRRF